MTFNQADNMRALKLLIIVGVLNMFPFVGFSEESSIDSRLFEAGREIIDAQRKGEFERIAERMHSYSLSYFRKIINIRIGQLGAWASEEDLTALIGMPLEEIDKLSDRMFFVRICESAARIRPGRFSNDRDFQFKPLGVVYDDEGFYHLLYRYITDVSNEEGKIEVRSPLIFTFVKEQDHIWLWSVLFASDIPRIWHEKLTETGRPG